MRKHTPKEREAARKKHNAKTRAKHKRISAEKPKAALSKRGALINKVKSKKDEQIETFLAALAGVPSVSEACRESGLTRREMYFKRQGDEVFRQRWDEAIAVGVKAAEDELVRRAMIGTKKPYYDYERKKTRTLRQYSDDLLKFLLRHRMADVYGDREAAPQPAQSLSVGIVLQVKQGQEGLYSGLRQQISAHLAPSDN